MASFWDHCGLRLTLEKDGVGEAYCDIRQEHMNGWNAVHGGMTFTMLDTAAGASARSLTPEGTTIVTSCANIHYLRPLHSGTMFAHAEVIKSGRKLMVSRAELRDAEGNLCACGDFEMFVVNKS